jgi:hypothetical protein
LAEDWAEKKQEHHVTSRIGRSSAAVRFRPSLQVRKKTFIYLNNTLNLAGYFSTIQHISCMQLNSKNILSCTPLQIKELLKVSKVRGNCSFIGVNI